MFRSGVFDVESEKQVQSGFAKATGPASGEDSNQTTADGTGVLRCVGAALADDTKVYEYGHIRMTSQVFVVEGAR